MIPDLNELPRWEAEPSLWRRALRPLVGLVLVAGFTGGLIWFYAVGLKEAVQQETAVAGALRGIAADLWRKGTAAEIGEMDPDLPGEIARLRKGLGAPLAVVVMPLEGAAGGGRATHEFDYLQGKEVVLRVQARVDQAGGRVDVLSFRTSPGFDGVSGR